MDMKKSKIYKALRTLYYEILSFKSYTKSRKFSGQFFSQFGEDKEIAKLFENTSRGFYFDIGSGHPVYGSNTYYFYKLKWSGVVVDPVKWNSILHHMVRPRDVVISAAVGSVNGKIECFVYPAHIFSTSNVDRRNQLMSENIQPMHSKLVNCVRFDTICQQFSGVNLDNCFLSIDVEGDEYNVLSSINFSSFRPKLICVEDIKGDNANVKDLLVEHNYKFFKRCGLSDLYLRSDLDHTNS